MKEMRVSFTVSGSTQNELSQRATEALEKLVEGEAPDFSLDVRPLAEAHQGGIVQWEAEVTAIV